MTGKQLRLSRLFRSGKSLILPLDHGITIGPVAGLENISDLVKSLNGSIDAVVVHKGIAAQAAEGIGTDGCQLIVHLSASTILSPDPTQKELVTSVEHAVRIGASAISVHVNLGGVTESKMLRDLGDTAEQCEKCGLPLMAMMYVRDNSRFNEYDPEKIAHAARVAEELGADIVKVNYTGSIETFAMVVDSVKIPIVIAGGPKMSSDAELLAMVGDAIKAGAAGAAIGRNLFQHAQPKVLAAALRKVLDGAALEDCVLQ